MKTRACGDCGDSFARLHGNQKYCPPCGKARQYQHKPRATETCIVCGDSILHRYPTAKYCDPCAKKQVTVNARLYKPANNNDMARRITQFAIKVGFLSPPTELNCVDCKTKDRTKRAQCYDHRDYSKPLEVDPVCLQCNSSRGRGIRFHAPKKIEAA